LAYETPSGKTTLTASEQWSGNCFDDGMASDVREVDIHEVLERHQVRYEVRPYYVVLDQRPVDAPPIQQRVQAGFDVDLYGTLEKEELPLFQSEGARRVVDYFETIAKEIQLKVGHKCTIEIMPFIDSLVLDTHQHFQPQAMLRIRISHARGLDQPEGSPEEQALITIQGRLRELKVREL